MRIPSVFARSGAPMGRPQHYGAVPCLTPIGEEGADTFSPASFREGRRGSSHQRPSSRARRFLVAAGVGGLSLLSAGAIAAWAFGEGVRGEGANFVTKTIWGGVTVSGDWLCYIPHWCDDEPKEVNHDESDDDDESDDESDDDDDGDGDESDDDKGDDDKDDEESDSDGNENDESGDERESPDIGQGAAPDTEPEPEPERATMAPTSSPKLSPAP